MGGKGSRGRKTALDMLDRSHRKLEQHLVALRAAATRLAAGDSDSGAMDTVAEVLEFFDRSVMRHEADEEKSLFPRLRGRAGIDVVIATLSDEHREHKRILYRLHELIKTWALERPSAEQGAHLLRLANELGAAYERHIELEDHQLFPAARATLAPGELDRIADEMQARRGRD